MNKTGLEKLNDWYNQLQIGNFTGLDIIIKAKELIKEEQAQKHTAPTGLVEELRGDFMEMLHADMEYNFVDELESILSRYERAQEGK